MMRVHAGMRRRIRVTRIEAQQFMQQRRAGAPVAKHNHGILEICFRQLLARHRLLQSCQHGKQRPGPRESAKAAWESAAGASCGEVAARRPAVRFRYCRLTRVFASALGIANRSPPAIAAARVRIVGSCDRGSRSAPRPADEARPFCIEVKHVLILPVDHADGPVVQRFEGAVLLQVLAERQSFALPSPCPSRFSHPASDWPRIHSGLGWPASSRIVGASAVWSAVKATLRLSCCPGVRTISGT